MAIGTLIETGNINLATIVSRIPALVGGRVPVDFSGSIAISNFPSSQAVTGSVSISNFPATQPISAVALPLPTGASTSALQTTGNTSLGNIDTKTPALGQATMANSTPVVFASNQSALSVVGTFWQTTQPISGSVTISNFPVTQPISGSVSVSNLPATQPVSGSVSISNFPASQAVTGVFWQSTQPTSLATLPALVAGTAIVGKFGIDQTTPGTTNLVSIGTNGTVAINAALPTGTNSIGAVTNTNLDVALSTRLKPADTLTGVTTVTTVTAVTAITNALPAGTNKIGTVDIATAAATAKGTQGANGVPTQDLKDAGRNQVNFFMAAAIAATATDALMSLTGYKSGAAVGATTTPAVVTAGKTLRVQSVTITYVTLATNPGAVKFTLRANTGGVVALGSPAVKIFIVGEPSGAAPVAGKYNTVTFPIPDGMEFAAGTGIGFSMVGLNTVGAAAAAGFGHCDLDAYEY